MSSNRIILIILAINTLIAFGVLIWDVTNKNKNDKIIYVHFIVIFLCPVLGIGYFLGAYILLKTGLRSKELTYNDISFDATRHIKKQKSNFLEEVDILPLEEAFAVSEKSDRRRALLTTLKKDYAKNISTVLQGLNNEDSETSHYAASVVLSTTSDYLNILSKLKTEYENSPGQLEPARKYLNGLKKFMQSNLLDNVDKMKYSRIYLNIFNFIYEKFNEDITDEDYAYIIQILLEMNDREAADLWADRAIRSFPQSNSIYYYAMKLHYTYGDVERFFQLLDELMRSGINISNETLQVIRFFNYR